MCVIHVQKAKVFPVHICTMCFRRPIGAGAPIKFPQITTLFWSHIRMSYCSDRLIFSIFTNPVAIMLVISAKFDSHITLTVKIITHTHTHTHTLISSCYVLHPNAKLHDNLGLLSMCYITGPCIPVKFPASTLPHRRSCNTLTAQPVSRVYQISSVIPGRNMFGSRPNQT